MKKCLILALFSLYLVTGIVLATVGGPTYISHIAYKASENSVYYILDSEDGRGCPEIVHKINLTTLKDTEVKSCDQLETEEWYSEKGQQEYSQFKADIYKDLSYLGSVSLPKNKISVEVKFLKGEFMEGFDEPVWSEFEARVSQDGKELNKINFRGCSQDQPHVFEGYMVPDTDAMAMLISNKGDCFEGGYVKETLHVMKGLKYLDTNIVRDIKTQSATEPNTGNLVVYAGQATTPIPTPNPELVTRTETSTSNKNLYIILALGIALGFIFAIASRFRK